MPEIGEVRKASEIGKGGKHLFIWRSCPDCGKESWVVSNSGRPVSLHCKPCGVKRGTRRGAESQSWKGGRRKQSDGYILLLLTPDNPYYLMASNRNMILEHRYVMAKHLGRCLAKSEHVHHKNGIRTDNQIENLELMSQSDHNTFQTFCLHCELRKELRLQKWQIKNLEEQVRSLTSKLMGVN